MVGVASPVVHLRLQEDESQDVLAAELGIQETSPEAVKTALEAKFPDAAVILSEQGSFTVSPKVVWG